MNMNPLSPIDKSMNLGQISVCLLCAVLGAGFVKVLDRFDSDDSVTAKRILVTDSDGKTVIQMDGSGLQVLAEDEDSYTRIKGGERPQIDLVRDGNTVVTLGQNSTGTDGLALYHGGKMAGAFSVNDDRSVLGLFAPNADASAPNSWDELMTSSKGFVYMAARSNQSIMRVSFGDEAKDLTVPGENKEGK